MSFLDIMTATLDVASILTLAAVFYTLGFLLAYGALHALRVLRGEPADPVVGSLKEMLDATRDREDSYRERLNELRDRAKRASEEGVIDDDARRYILFDIEPLEWDE